MSIEFDNTDLFLAKCEKALNVFDYIPFISSLSAAIRATAAKVMITVCTIFAVVFGIGSLFDRRHLSTCTKHLSYVIHGFANIFRACFASIPFVNLVLIGYDQANRFKYDAEIAMVQPIRVPG